MRIEGPRPSLGGQAPDPALILAPALTQAPVLDLTLAPVLDLTLAPALILAPAQALVPGLTLAQVLVRAPGPRLPQYLVGTGCLGAEGGHR